ncbi:MAG: 30S ribosomal protein S18 [Lachnospiraceae bacterium]|nr:30S ribosomal protein S18 [Lachnospiraceae bacterium]
MAFNKDKEGGFKRRGGDRHRRKKVCAFCGTGKEPVSYKNVAVLRKFVSERGKILPRRATGTCAEHQRAVTLAVKRARHLALMPYQVD